MPPASAAAAGDKVFTGAIPRIYETHLVPLIFQPYAADLAARVRQAAPLAVLEVAAGTGVVPRALDAALPAAATIVATDLNPAMLAEAATHATQRTIEWRAADAQSLPFDDASFDAVVCQFGAMFFPDRPHAYAEARRVLRPGGLFVFSVWDRIEENEFADVVTRAVGTLFPADPPRFLARTPHGYHDTGTIARDVVMGGFARPRIDTVTARSRADSARIVSIAYCQGTPLRGEIEARDPARLAEATDVGTAALAADFGTGPVDGRIQAHVVAVTR